MARYVIANRRAGKFREGEKLASREAVETTLMSMSASLDIIQDFNPPDPLARRVLVVEADAKEVQQRKLNPDVLMEPEILHFPEIIGPRDFPANTASVAMPAVAAAAITALSVTVRGSGAPQAGAKVLLFLRGARDPLEKVSDASGKAKYSFSSQLSASALVVEPAGGFWTMLVRGPSPDSVVDCIPLPANGPLEWWHRMAGIAAFDAALGTGIKVGVIDTGVGPHVNLAHVVRVGAFIGGEVQPGDAAADVDMHGSHVCGIIGARPSRPGDYAGIAPGVDLFCARVFPPGGGANQGDIANAIDELSRNRGVDLINMSLGAARSAGPSQIEQDAIRDALERGTLCVCAAGNDNTAVGFPAAFPEAAAISALGLLGWGPPGTLASTRLPQDPARFGSDNLYLANFSCFGSEVAAGAPGVGIVSTVPERFGLAGPYAAMDGTSMASPLACGTLAAILALSPDYQALPRDQSRAEMARGMLRDKGRDIGMNADFQGAGVPTLTT